MALKKISIQKLQTGMFIADPVYQALENRQLLLLPQNTVIVSDTQIRRLIDAGVTQVTIDTDEGIDTFQSLMFQRKWEEVAPLSKDLDAYKTRVAKHFGSFISAMTAIVTKSPSCRYYLGNSKVSLTLRGVVLEVQNSIDALMALIRLRALQELSFAHSVQVTVLCSALAHELGFTYADVVRFCTGVLMADIGMTSYPSSMIRRPAGLSRKELDEIKKHPQYTSDFLNNIGITDKLIHTLILQHHERFDGSGYPQGLSGDAIHPISKLFAIADVYLAMTSPRPHRSGMSPHLALAELHQKSGTLFDPAMVRFFIKQVGIFPIGNMVELTGGRYGIVAVPNREDQFRPVVILFETKKRVPQYDRVARENEERVALSRGRWELVDLSKQMGEEFGRIKRGLDHRVYRINPLNFLNQM